ncbi:MULTISPECIES: PTS cellobiose transporter subunit IIC [Bacteroides]
MKYHRITCNLYKTTGNSWEQMAEELLSSAVREERVLRLVLFTRCTDNQEYKFQRSFLEQWVERHFVSPRPVVSLVAQKPLVADLVLEVHSLVEITDEAVTIEEQISSFSVRYLRIMTPHYREIIVGGLYADDLNLPVREQSEQAFRKAEEILKAEQMNFGDIVRQWNYLENITDIAHGNQCYQDFNDVRTLFYASSEWELGYPAATGIGPQHGGVLIDFNAVSGEVNIAPLDNDWQRAAHVYSDEVLISHRADGKKGTPKFERGKSLSDRRQEVIYISGTAAIRGEESVTTGDVLSQTEITLENIQHLIGLEEGREKLPEHSGKLGLLRVYLKNEEDAPAVKADLDKLCPDIPIVYLYADVCREELLVEIEGIAYL